MKVLESGIPGFPFGIRGRDSDSHRLSNGRMEGLNNKIGVIKLRAYGFHSFAALAAMVFLCCTDPQLTVSV